MHILWNLVCWDCPAPNQEWYRREAITKTRKNIKEPVPEKKFSFKQTNETKLTRGGGDHPFNILKTLNNNISWTSLTAKGQWSCILLFLESHRWVRKCEVWGYITVQYTLLDFLTWSPVPSFRHVNITYVETKVDMETISI